MSDTASGPAAHACGTCEGIDPDTCLANPDRPALFPSPCTDPNVVTASVITASVIGAQPLKEFVLRGNRPDGDPIVTLNLETGDVTFSPAYTPGEAAQVFWDAVRDIARQNAFGQPLWASIDGQLRAGERAERQVRRLDEMAEAWKALPDTVATATVIDAVHLVTRPEGRQP